VKGCKYRESVRTEEVVSAVWEAVTRSKREIVRCLGKQVCVSTSTARKICHDDLSVFLHRMQQSQPLLKNGTARYYAFAREYKALLGDSSSVLNVTWFSDDTHFHLDGYFNK
jgi:hypothetical protein